jgi:hypothetical protein
LFCSAVTATGFDAGSAAKAAPPASENPHATAQQDTNVAIFGILITSLFCGSESHDGLDIDPIGVMRAAQVLEGVIDIAAGEKVAIAAL